MADSTFAEHVATTNNRLASLKHNLVDPSTFSESCIELTKWCQDQRAFTAHFEDNLMSALEVAMDYGTRENYDYMLTHGLVGACFTHRKYLSKQSGTRISRWYEQMRRLKKNGGKRKRAPPKPKEPPVTSSSSAPVNGSLPGLTSLCTLPPPPPPSSQSSGGLAPSNGGQPTENNNFMFSSTSNSDGIPPLGFFEI
uniref:Zmiz1_N domain-containing protein n=1 Tax=Caenorhabditis tropicalis TaxID=1561998 RepID=A0A1I7UNA3_9PELO